MTKTLIIAEAGVNHNGDINIAKKLVDAASDAGADYIKFQTFKANKLVSNKAKIADYQKNLSASDSQMSLLKNLELDSLSHEILVNHCKKRGIKFLSTAFDLESVELLKSLNLDLFKIPSGEITNLPYLKRIGVLNSEIVISTGMCELKEIGNALDVLIYSGTLKENITVLHCTTEYPTPFQDVNLTAMQAIKSAFNVKIGYSDHTLGIEVPIAAVALGASVIEKHFTLSREMVGPDHKASLEPIELKNMVHSIRNIEKAISGSGIKKPFKSELKNRDLVRKSIHLKKSLKQGEILTDDNLIALRPGTGISPMQINSLIGKTLVRDLEENHLLSWEDIK